ncbi:MAG: metalloregulator ArsR/SmtB family transcription factor [Verrucomicrobiia bacterium]|jgi:ArsR family transcriptional regulator
MDKPNQLFKAFSDETRLRILNLLAQRDHCVCEFQSILRVPQPTISRHLAYLRRSGLVEVERHGKMVMYSLAEPRDAVHAALLRCIRGCFREFDFLRRDMERGKKAKRVICK